MQKIFTILFLAFVNISAVASTPQVAFDTYKLGTYQADCAIYHNLLAIHIIAKEAADATVLTTTHESDYSKLKADFENQRERNYREVVYHKAKAAKFEQSSLKLMYQSLIQFDDADLPRFSEVFDSGNILNGYNRNFEIGYIIASYRLHSAENITRGLKVLNHDDSPNSNRENFIKSFKCDE